MKSNLFGAVCASILTVTVSLNAHSALVAVNNHDFELPALADGDINGGEVPGWSKTLTNGFGGTFNPSGSQWYLTSDDEDTAAGGGVFGTMDGPSLGYFYQSSTGAMSQELVEELSVGTIYRLTVAIGWRDAIGSPANGPFAGYIIELLSGGQVVASTNSDTAPGVQGTFEDVALTYTAALGDPIGPLGIRIGVKNFGHLDFDNVRLDTVPLPPSVWLFGSGILGLVGIARRKKAA